MYRVPTAGAHVGHQLTRVPLGYSDLHPLEVEERFIPPPYLPNSTKPNFDPKTTFESPVHNQVCELSEYLETFRRRVWVIDDVKGQVKVQIFEA